MAAATATMDDLIASLGGSMHVSPDLKALQDYLAQNMVRPSMPLSPNVSFRPIPPSRSTSSTRKPNSLPSSYTYPESNMIQAYPSPISQQNSYFGAFQDETLMNVTTPTQAQRPGGPLRRSSSYGFGFGQAPPSPQTAYSSFESDAFAPLWQEQQQQQYQPQQQAQDPWAKMRAQGPNAFSGYNAQAGPSHGNAFGGFRPAQGFGMTQQPMMETPPTPPAEDDEEMMDEDCIDAEMDGYDEEEDTVERVMGISSNGMGLQMERRTMEQYGGQRDQDDIWGRGRRKF